MRQSVLDRNNYLKELVIDNDSNLTNYKMDLYNEYQGLPKSNQYLDFTDYLVSVIQDLRNELGDIR